MVLEVTASNPFEAAAHERPDHIPDVPEEHIPYLEENVYPTLLQGMERLLQRLEDRPNEDVNAVNWLANYLLNNNPNNSKSLLRSGDELAKCEIARRERRKQEALDRTLALKKEEWRDFAVTAASMRAAHRLSKEIPGSLTKALKPLAERRVFFKHSTRKRAPSLAPKEGQEDAVDEADEDSEEEVAMGVLDVMQSSMGEALIKRRGQHALLGLLFDMIKSEHDPFASFFGLLETDEDQQRSLRVIGGLGTEIECLIGTQIEEDGCSECFRVLDAGVIIIQDQAAPNLPEELQSSEYSWLLVPVPEKVQMSQLEDTEEPPPKARPIGLIAISIPRREATTIEMVTAPKPELEEGEEEEEDDEEQIAYNEMLDSLKSAAKIFGNSICEAWDSADEPQLHRSTVQVAELVDAAMERNQLTLSGVRSLCASVSAHLAQTMEKKCGSAVSCVVGFKDPNTELLVPCVHKGVHWVDSKEQHLPFTEDDMLWEVISSAQKFQCDMLPRNRTVCGMIPQSPGSQGESVASFAALGIPLILETDKQADEERPEVIGAIGFIRATNQLGENVSYADGAVSGFSKDELILAEMAAGPLAAGCEAVSIREQIEDLLDGLLRRFGSKHEVLKPGQIEPMYEGPAVFKFKRQAGPTSQEVTIHSDRRGVLSSALGEECDSLPVRPEIATTCSVVFQAEAPTQSATTQQLDEVRDVSTIALTHICNRNHRPLLEVQHKAHCVHHWMLCAEALVEFHRLQLGRLTESELLELEPRLEPPQATNLMIDATLLLLGSQTAIDILPWKQRRVLLGAPMLQRLIDFDPTSRDVTQETVRCAVACWKQAGEMRDQMCAAAMTLYEWMGAILWARKEMRAIAGITRQASFGGAVAAMKTGDQKLVQSILSVDQFDMTAADGTGQTMLHHVAENCQGSSAAFTELVLSAVVVQQDDAQLSAFVNLANQNGDSALHLAVAKGDAEMLGKLLGAGADVELVNGSTNTPLVIAAASQSVACAQMLLDAKADVNALTGSRHTALDACGDCDEMRDLLVMAGGKVSTTLLASNASDVDDTVGETEQPIEEM